MIPLSSALSGGLTWSKLSRNRGYELRRNDEIVGSLQRPGFRSSSYLAETQGGHWTFRRDGFLGSGAQILDSASQQEIATFTSAWSGAGTLTFADGPTFHVECKGWRHPVWSVIAQNGETLLRMHVCEETVEVPTGTAVPDGRLSLLIMFTGYRVLQAEDDAASAAMVA